MIKQIQTSLYAKYLPLVIVSMVLQLVLTLAMIRLSQGMAGTDVNMDDEAQRLYCRILGYVYSPPGVSIWQRFISSCSSLLDWVQRVRQSKTSHRNSKGNEFLLDPVSPMQRD